MKTDEKIDELIDKIIKRSETNDTEIEATKPMPFRYITDEDENESIEIFWNPSPPDDTVEYEIYYPLGQDASYPEGYEASGHIPSTSTDVLVVDVNNFGFNQPVPIYIFAIDAAGNISGTGTVYTPYTLPEPGTLVKSQVEYDEVYGHHFKWTLVGGNAKEQVLKAIGYDEDENPYVKYEIQLENGEFFDDNDDFEPHGTYYYRLVAYSNCHIEGQTGHDQRRWVAASAHPYRQKRRYPLC